jgi:hypothetical protein
MNARKQNMGRFRLCMGYAVPHCATSRKVAGSTIENITNPFSCSKTLGSTQPLTEMIARNLPGCKKRPVCCGWQFHRRLWVDCLENAGASTSKNLWDSTACYRDKFTFLFNLYSNTCSAQLWTEKFTIRNAITRLEKEIYIYWARRYWTIHFFESNAKWKKKIIF